jgi:hypothetical protein
MSAHLSEEVVMAAKLEVLGAALGIKSLPEEQLYRRLEALYTKGFEAGGETSARIMKSMAEDMTKLVVAHLSGDADALKAAMDEFVRTHVKFVNAPATAAAQTVTH